MSAVFALILGIMLFGSTFVMFVRTMEDIRNNRLPSTMVPAALTLAVGWLVMAVLGLFVISFGVFDGLKTLLM